MYPTSEELKVRDKRTWELNFLESVGGRVHPGTNFNGRGLVPARGLWGTQIP